MEIRCADGGDGGRSYFPATHEEIHPTGILSVVASLTPWSDHNQSPRNMYQCQVFSLPASPPSLKKCNLAGNYVRLSHCFQLLSMVLSSTLFQYPCDFR